MPMTHKAYAFDWSRFEFGLLPILIEALIADDTAALEAFIDDNHALLTDPYEGEPLPNDWRAGLNWDVHVYGDYALSAFYDPADDCGIAGEWGEVSECLPGASANALLGFSLGPPERPFDPGRYGSYFQTPSQVQKSLEFLQPLGMPELSPFVDLLARCNAEGRGVYVTF